MRPLGLLRGDAQRVFEHGHDPAGNERPIALDRADQRDDHDAEDREHPGGVPPAALRWGRVEGHKIVRLPWACTSPLVAQRVRRDWSMAKPIRPEEVGRLAALSREEDIPCQFGLSSI